MSNKNSTLIKYSILALFIIFVLLRLFVDSPIDYISGDDAKFLGLAKNFPNHTLHGDFLYLAHGPIFPYAIKFFNLFVEDHIAGFFVAFTSSLIIFLFIILLFRLFNKDWNWIFYSLLIYSLSVFNITLSHAVLKETFFMVLALASIYFYLRAIKISSRNLWLASLFGILTSMISDHVIFIIAILVLTFIIFAFKQKITVGQKIKLIVPIVLTIISYTAWLFVRIYVYTHHTFHPSGGDGLFEYVRNFGWKQIIAPFSFPETLNFHSIGLNLHIEESISALAYVIDIFPFSIPLALRADTVHILLQTKYLLFIFLIYFPLVILIAIPILYSLYILLKKKTIFDNVNLYFILFLLIAIFPVFNLAATRYGVLAIVPISYFFATSVSFILKIFPRLEKIIPIIILIVLLISTTLYVSNNPILFFEQEKLVETQSVADFIETLPDGAVMAQMGYSLELAYLLDQPAYALPFDTNRLEILIQMFDIKYLVYGQKYWAPVSEGETEWVLNYETIKHIQAHPERFKLLKIIKEYDPDNKIVDELYVYSLKES
ncbi:MAG: hypothetical protein KAT43_00510 [Nanoarchaeota archaeon]|nr:hypothetical protein [Nanoarchaeota archaeon]